MSKQLYQPGDIVVKVDGTWLEDLRACVSPQSLLADERE